MVMLRAFRQISMLNYESLLDVAALNCINGCEAEINVHQFFMGYMEGRYNEKGWPQILKLKDWPPSSLFEESLPHHSVEFIACLPFKEYTHPRDGYLNLAVKLPTGSLKTYMGPKTFIAYGITEDVDDKQDCLRKKIGSPGNSQEDSDVERNLHDIDVEGNIDNNQAVDEKRRSSRKRVPSQGLNTSKRRKCEKPEKSFDTEKSDSSEEVCKNEQKEVIKETNEHDDQFYLKEGGVPYDPGGCGSDSIVKLVENSRTSFFEDGENDGVSDLPHQKIQSRVQAHQMGQIMTTPD